MAERLTAQRNTRKSAISNPLDESINQDQSTDPTSHPERTQEKSPQLFKSESHPGWALTVLEIGTLSDLDNVAVRIADVAPDLAVFGYWWRNELGSPAFP